MVGIFTGSGTGYERGSGALLGAAGLIGSSALGRGGEQVFVNGATGNLLVSRQDEFMVGLGPDVGISRTYNSLGNFSDENGDNWRQSTDRVLVHFTGSANKEGSTITRRTSDGSELVYRWRSGSTYENVDGAGATDTLVNQGTQWVWTDGATGETETYSANGDQWRITAKSDTSGNSLSFHYVGDKLQYVESADGGQVQYDWDGNNIAAIVTSSHGSVLTRTRYTYDSYNRLSSVVTDKTPEDSSITDGKVYTTTYTYVGTSKLVASISQTDGSYVEFAYDSSSRVTSITQTIDTGVTRTTWLSYGLNYTNITDPSGQVTRLDYLPTDLAQDISSWAPGNLSATPATIDGEPALTYTVQSSIGWAAAYKDFGQVAVGDTLALGLTFQATSSSGSQTFGLYGAVDQYGSTGAAIARIVSGPGTLVQLSGAVWQVDGLSTTEPTRIELMRIFTVAEDALAYIYVDGASGFRAGAQLTVGNVSVLKSSTAADVASLDMANWGFANVTRTAVGTFTDGEPAYRFTVQNTGSWAGIGFANAANRNDTYSFAVNLQAEGSVTSQVLGLYGDITQYGDGDTVTSARIISGPGTINQIQGGLYSVDGLSTSQVTRVEVTRTFDRTEGGAAFLLPDWWGGYRAGETLLAGGPSLVKRLVQPTSAGLLSKITLPAAYAGAPQQVIQFEYNDDGDLLSVTDAANATTHYAYDADKNLLTETDPLGHQVSRTYNEQNQLLTETRVGSDTDSASANHTTRYAYDSAGRLRFTVSADGDVVKYQWNGSGQLEYTTEFTGQRYDVSSLAATIAISEAALITWAGGQTDPTAIKQVYHEYDVRGEESHRYEYASSTAPGAPVTSGPRRDSGFTYDQAGQLLSRTVQVLNTESFVYDGLGRVVASTDLNGATTHIRFDDCSTQTVITLANGLVKTSTYDKRGNLVAYAESADAIAGASAAGMTYKYDADGRLTQASSATGATNYYVYDKAGRKVADINLAGWVTEYVYDSADRVVATVRYLQNAKHAADLNNPDHNQELSYFRPNSDPDDFWTWRVYDSADRLIESIEGDGSVTSYAYDASDRLIGTTSYFHKLSPTQVSALRTAPPTSIVLPTGDTAKDGVARNFYDKDGRLVAVLDGEGSLSLNVYDAAGQKVEVVAYANRTDPEQRASGTLSELLAGLASANDSHHHYVYDGEGLLRFEVDSLNRVTDYYYGDFGTANGSARVVTRYAGTITPPATFTVATVQSAMASAGLYGNPDSRTSWAVYDSANRLAYAIDAAGFVTAYSYNSLGQVTKTVQYATARATSSLPNVADMEGWATGAASADDRTTRNFYNAAGELRFVMDPEGYVTRNDYDAEGRIVGKFRWDTALSPSDGWTLATLDAGVSGAWVGNSYSYDYAGNLSYSQDGEGNYRSYYYYSTGLLAWDISMNETSQESRTLYTYDKAGRVSTVYQAYGTPEQGATTYDYDGQGNQISVTDGNNNTTYREYDRAGQLVTETDAAGVATTFEYDAFGHVARTTRLGANSYSFYDKAGRLTTSVDALNFVTETSYTVFGEVQSVTRRANAANSPAVGTPPTFASSAADATTSFEYDRLGRLTKTVDALGAYEQYTLGAFGNRTEVRNKLGGITYNSFDRRGLLVEEELPMASVTSSGTVEAATVSNRFEYDARGNRTKMIEAFGLSEQRTTSYFYDEADRLEEKRGDQVLDRSGAAHTPSEYYEYDARGNLIKTTDANGAASFFYYDHLDRKVAEVDALGTLSTYGYDANGNLTLSRVYGTPVTIPSVAGGAAPVPPAGELRETSYQYDAVNRLQTSTVASGPIGAWDDTTSTWTTSVDPAVTQYDYDVSSLGEVVRVTDAAGGKTYTYYDKLGQKIREVDAEGYATKWSYDAEGNVTQERRWAGKAALAPSMTGFTDPVDDAAADRVTSFTYDKNGRRLSETRANVVAYTVSGLTLSLTSTSSTIGYLYNAAGQVTRKTEATGEAVDYDYDQSGRLMQETRAAIWEHDFGWANPTVLYSYDGLNNLVRTVQTRTQSGGDQRVTRNLYGAGGRLSATIDAAGNQRNYFYDTAGNLAAERWTRTGSTYAATGGYEGIGYTRDAAGRVVRQDMFDIDGSGTWHQAGDYVRTAYNAYGDVSARATNRDLSAAQERFVYDAAGRLSGSNGGDGVWRHYYYDGAGRQTLMLESEGTNLADLTAEQALVAGATAAGGEPQDGVVATISVLDKRGQAVETRQPARELATGVSDDLVTARTYNAFGEVASECDARGNTTYYSYNAMGRTTAITHPSVTVVGADGASGAATPIDHAYYDLSGRLIGSQDANLHYTTRLLLAGSGYGGTEALTTYEYHADGGVKLHVYDAYGEQRVVTDELGRNTITSYDALGRVVEVDHDGGMVDTYGYDQLGHQTSHANTVLGTGANAEAAGYDLMGRLTSQTAYGGIVTGLATSWNDALSSGLGATGAWVTITTAANGLTSSETNDQFGHQLAKTDLGGHAWSLSYDLAGRMTGRSGQDSATYDYYNTGLIKSAAAGGLTAGYGYDASGNRVIETLHDGTYTRQNATADYDAMGRMTHWSESGLAVTGSGTLAATPAASLDYGYDAVGNIRRSQAGFSSIGADGTATPGAAQDYWYAYDAMNRVVTAKGALVSGAIVRGSQGTDYLYDAAGQRVSATHQAQLKQLLWRSTPLPNGVPTWWDEDPELDGDHVVQLDYEYTGDRQESYSYDAGGALAAVSVAQTLLAGTGGTSPSVVGMGTAVLTASFTNDAAGRQTRQIDYLPNGSVGYDRQVTFNAAGQVSGEAVSQRQGNDTLTSIVTNQYGTGTGYGLGAMVSSATSESRLSGGTTTTSASATTNSLAWWDGAVTASSSAATTPTGGTTTTIVTSYSYGADGSLQSVGVGGTAPYNVTFTNDLNGQAIARDRGALGTTGPHELWYRYGGKTVGYTGNNGTQDTDYTASLAARTTAPGTGPFRGGAAGATAYADFDQSLAPINSYSQGGGGGSYEARAGDTLAGIAANLWGDSALWYKLAEVNGLGANAALVEGQRISVPAGVMKNSHNAGTFNPYDPSEVIGDIGPAPKPGANKNKCGVFGAVILAAVAVAVTIATSGTLTAALGPVLGGALSGAAGSVASQMVGLATGIQDKFDWKGVALSAIGGGVGGGLTQIGGKVGAFLNADKLLSNVAKGVAGNLANQGLAMATGLQAKFDWAGVAAAGLGSYAGGLAGRALAGPIGKIGSGVVRDMARGGATATADAITSAAATSLINGTSFGDNLLTVLPNVISRTVGNMISGEVQRGQQRQAAREAASQGNSVAIARALAGAFPIEHLSLDLPTLDLGGLDLGGDTVSGLGIVEQRRLSLQLMSPLDRMIWEGRKEAVMRRIYAEQTGEPISDEPLMAGGGVAASGLRIIQTRTARTFSRSINGMWKDGYQQEFDSHPGVYDPDAFHRGLALYDTWDQKLQELDWLATREVDIPIALVFGGVATAGAGGALGTLTTAGMGLEGAGAFMYGTTVDGATTGVSNLFFRGATGDEISPRTLATDILLGGVGSAATRTLLGVFGGQGVPWTAPTPAAAEPVLGIEAQFQANSLRIADEAHGLFIQGIENGSIPRNLNIPLNTQAGGFVDQQVRYSNLALRDALGLDSSAVRINQRLYAPDGRYTIPDIYFPESGNIIDYSYQLKTTNTRQILGFRSASPAGTITIVPPSAIRPVYVIGH
jgi:YD repeat-containing protein